MSNMEDIMDAADMGNGDEDRRDRYEDWVMFTYLKDDRGSRLAGASFAAFEECPQNAVAFKTAMDWMKTDPRPTF